MKRSIELDNTNSDAPGNFSNNNVSWTNTSQTSPPPEQAQGQPQNVAPATQNAAPATTIIPVNHRISFNDITPDVLPYLLEFADPLNNPQFELVSKPFFIASKTAVERQIRNQHSPLNEEIQHFVENEENIYKNYFMGEFTFKWYITELKSLKNDDSLAALKSKEALLNELNNGMCFGLMANHTKFTSDHNGNLTLYWSGCYLTRLPSNKSFMRRDFSWVETWDLSDNKLSSIPQYIWGSENLKCLDIKGNLFKDLPANAPDILYTYITDTDGERKLTKLTKAECLRMQKDATVNENTSNKRTNGP